MVHEFVLVGGHSAPPGERRIQHSILEDLGHEIQADRKVSQHCGTGRWGAVSVGETMGGH